MNQVLRPRAARPQAARAPARAPAPRPGRTGLYRGWFVVAGAFLVTMVGFGAIYSYAAFAEDIGATFGAERASVTVVFALSGGSCFFVSALTGPLADRIGARVLAAIGMLLVGFGFLVAASAGSLIEVYVGYGLLIGLGCGFAYVPAIAAVQRCFYVHRGLASGIAVSGIGVGTALVPQAADAFSAIGDWRTTFVACGALAALVGTAGALLLTPAPHEREVAPGLRPTPPASVLSRDFVLVYAGALLVSLPAALPHAMLVGTARDMGLDRQDALALLGLIGIGTIVGRFLLAALADAIGRRVMFLLCCGGMAAAMLVWAAAEDERALQAFALGFGALQGGFVALLPAFVADRFGSRSLGGLLGVLYTSRGIALLAAPPLLALSLALLAGHALPVVASALLGAAGTLLMACIGRDERRRAQRAAAQRNEAAVNPT